MKFTYIGTQASTETHGIVFERNLAKDVDAKRKGVIAKLEGNPFFLTDKQMTEYRQKLEAETKAAIEPDGDQG